MGAIYIYIYIHTYIKCNWAIETVSPSYGVSVQWPVASGRSERANSYASFGKSTARIMIIVNDCDEYHYCCPSQQH